ncbi:MAG TPA: GNAT family N-acetyltransferase [Chloroflexia bacterium]|nr:GNAT family N-acetyltransferase [Chloroflexia bacterium]
MDTISNEAETGQQKFILRPARTSDIKAIREVARITWNITYAHSVSPSNRERVIASSYSDSSLRRSFSREGRDNWFWVAETPGNPDQPSQIVGFADIAVRPGAQPHAELTRIYVLPEWQRQGVGKALIDALLAELRALRPELRPPRLYLSVAAHNRQAIAFYEQRGFRHNRDFQASLPMQLLDMQEYVLDI